MKIINKYGSNYVILYKCASTKNFISRIRIIYIVGLDKEWDWTNFFKVY